jgi:hypothetical protein
MSEQTVGHGRKQCPFVEKVESESREAAHKEISIFSPELFVLWLGCCLLLPSPHHEFCLVFFETRKVCLYSIIG